MNTTNIAINTLLLSFHDLLELGLGLYFYSNIKFSFQHREPIKQSFLVTGVILVHVRVVDEHEYDFEL